MSIQTLNHTSLFEGKPNLNWKLVKQFIYVHIVCLCQCRQSGLISSKKETLSLIYSFQLTTSDHFKRYGKPSLEWRNVSLFLPKAALPTSLYIVDSCFWFWALIAFTSHWLTLSAVVPVLQHLNRARSWRTPSKQGSETDQAFHGVSPSKKSQDLTRSCNSATEAGQEQSSVAQQHKLRINTINIPVHGWLDKTPLRVSSWEHSGVSTSHAYLQIYFTDPPLQ